MNRIEKFKSLLRERITGYEAKYKESGDRMMFGALNEAKDTLEYIEKVFPDSGDFRLHGREFEVIGRVVERHPGDFSGFEKFGVYLEHNGEVEEMLIPVEYDVAKIIEAFQQTLVYQIDKLISIERKKVGEVCQTTGIMYIYCKGELM